MSYHVHRCCAQDPDVQAEVDAELVEQLKEIPDDDNLLARSKVFHSLAHPIRLKIAFLLLQRDHCVCELVKLTQRKANLVSHHLMIMRKAGVISAIMKSANKYYTMKDSTAQMLKGLEK